MKTHLIRAIASAMFIFVAFAVDNVQAASPGSLDPTFGVVGMISRNIPGTGFISDIADQPDGKAVIVGYWQNGPTRDFIVVRLNANGDYDQTFGTGGIVFTDFGATYDDAFGVAIQSDGKIVVVGRSINGTTGFSDASIARYLPDGSLDSTFDGDGKFILNSFPGMVGDGFSSIVIQPDGKIIAGGRVQPDFLLVRVNLDGSIDSSFGNGGVVRTNNIGFVDEVRDMLVLPDGKIIAAGGSGRCAVARFNPNGSVDPAFGAAGFFIASPGYYTQCYGIEVQPDGKLVLAGTASPADSPPQYSSVVIRINTLGGADNTFGNNGFVAVNTNPAGADFFTTLSIQSDGKIIAAGFAGESSTYDFAVARLNSDGSFDNTFARNGIAKNNISGDDEIAASTMIGDKLLVVGDDSNGSGVLKAARYNLSVTPTSSSDFDGDGLPDYAVFRPSTGSWYVLRSSDNGVQVLQFGTSGDVPVDGDFDGDGLTDLAIFRPSLGQWWVNRSTSGAAFAIQFGQSTDKPTVGDYDKDGRTDIAFWRPSTGMWNVLRSSDGFTSYFGVPFGASGDIPIGAATQ